ncbi:hypothetical protein P5G50_02465 [Leifsonia sp. F6_8S_P_1B]|uniref:Transmembrane protein n=1 Tax=Leifsonia williamsii TaxID=3035919 RepID=A0ABT8K763_9MICO|nr:hypothetical protein [Leifsonia williamsii]MDN4613305.1 hypothetical protein [Leifsonia williamsii]
MTSTLDTTPGPSERARNRRFGLTFTIAMVAYGVVLVVSIVWGDLDGTSPWRFAWALAPVVPVAAAAALLIRYVVRSDEYEQIRTFKALGVGFVVAMLLAVVAGFLGIAGLDIPGLGWWLYSGGMLGWLAATIAMPRR